MQRQGTLSAFDRRRSRSAFSLIELMVVLVIIGILAGFLLPAIFNAMSTARVTAVTSDIKNLEKAIADFKLEYGVEPPSSFVLYENGQWNLDPTTPLGTLSRNSVAFMRKAWPNYRLVQISTNVIGTETGNEPGDLDGDGNLNTVFTLNGAECLLFFLGGPGTLAPPANPTASPPLQGPVANGFSSNPTNPFAGQDYRKGVPQTQQGNRTGPFYTSADPSRMSDIDGDLVHELMDTLPAQTMPYQYFSSYGGRGYQVFGFDGVSGNASQALDNEVMMLPGSTTPTMYSAYITQDLNWTAAAPNNVPTGPGWNPKTFQIISPGFDALYGVGGLYNSEKGIAVQASGTYRSSANRAPESDNITNFSNGSLSKTYQGP